MRFAILPFSIPVAAAVAVIAILPAFPASAATVRAGATCKRNAIGQTTKVGTAVLVCTKAGTKTVWKASAPVSVAAKAAAGASTAAAAGGSTTATAANSGSVEGTWKAGTGSVAGYRVQELFAGKQAKNPAVGRTAGVTGGLSIATVSTGLVAKDVKFDVDLTTLQSDEGRRDNVIRGRGLETSKFPWATFVAAAVALPADAGKNGPIKVAAKGKLTMHGVTKDIDVSLDAQLLDGVLEVSGQIPIHMADYAIDPPSLGGFVTVDPDGIIEFLVKLTKV